MGIEKMSLLSVSGPLDRLDNALMACCGSGQFQMTAAAMVMRGGGDQNPYSGIYGKVRDMALDLKIKTEYCDFKNLPYETSEDFEKYFEKINERYSDINGKLEDVRQSLEEHKNTEAYVKHLAGMNVSFKDLFNAKYVKIRIGRLPVDGVKKLEYYDNKCLIFRPFEQTPDYVYGIFVTSVSDFEFTDEVMRSLGFERVRLPDYLEDNAQDAEKKLDEQIANEEKRKEELEKELSAFVNELEGDFRAVLCKLKFKSDCYELRRKAVIADNRFSFSGYCPSREYKNIEAAVRAESDKIECTEIPVDRKGASAEVPVKLKNNFLTRPFEMFVKMYGLPTYNGFDPTPYVAFTYMILFGLMFGDVGQGLVVTLLGLLLTKTTKNGLAPIMTRLGFFSMAGGCIYGSVFGIETIITPIYHRENIWHGVCKLFSGLGIPEHPENIFQAATVVLLFALAIGIVLILISMIFNTVQNFKAGKTGAALFSVNGVAGIVFYAALVVGMVCQLLLGIPLLNAPYVICLIVLPILLIFFKEPLSDLISGRKHEEKISVGNFIIENFIELFESAISFLSNTMSYLRVGGFVLSHAGFMLVVSQLAGTTVPDAPITVKTVITYIIGNIIVMGIEGLLVGIQVLRLEFYEIFSRFYEGNGKSFTPVEIDLNSEI